MSDYDYTEFKNYCINIRASRAKLSVFLSLCIPLCWRYK